ncbi:hypothetical protein FB566_1765 [Stackebrandtia endophytica]|uniref:Uncharacterized protein n=1 Tax=Stackebrandtia endophytica TaxID=1496996 RepID=A0A543AUJ2_9ACTN|nr:hypothetical protein [Stackebrandtia endophytica]TQL76242.1 hypothetical protein FB566_1765 [Stackebrandtia endophytica]
MSKAELRRAQQEYQRWIDTEWDGNSAGAIVCCLDALEQVGSGYYGELTTLAEADQQLLIKCFCALYPARNAVRRRALDFYEHIGPGRLAWFATELMKPSGLRLFEELRRAQSGSGSTVIDPALRAAVDRHGGDLTFSSEDAEDRWSLTVSASYAGHVANVGGLWEAYALVRPNAMWSTEKVGVHRDLEPAIRDVLVNFQM